VTIDSCWSFRNGINVWNDAAFAGDGNAFKLGGAADTAEHIVTRSVAFDNAHNGFDQNYNNAGQTMYNCTAFRNGTSNYSFYQTPTAGKLKKHVIKNSISYLGGAPNVDATATQIDNSWPAYTVSATDFVSLDTSLALAPRGADYSLPKNGFLRLQNASQFVDKGVDVGLWFSGKAPDLGAFEISIGTSIFSERNVSSARKIRGNFSHANGALHLIIDASITGSSMIALMDMLGKKIYGPCNLQLKNGENEVPMNFSPAQGSVYFLALTNSAQKTILRIVSE
jgi:hypothetical protein